MTTRFGGFGAAMATAGVSLAAAWFLAPTPAVSTTPAAVTEPSTEPAPSSTDTIGDPSATTTTVETSSTTTPSTSTSTSTSTTTSTTTTTTSTSTPATAATSTSTSTSTSVAPAPLPLSVTVNSVLAGPGGTVRFEITCPEGSSDAGLGEIWIERLDAPADPTDTVEVVTVEPAGGDWAFEWIAPIVPAEIASRAFRFWCADPTGFADAYPAELVVVVDMVRSAATPTTTVPLPDPADVTLPETG